MSQQQQQQQQQLYADMIHDEVAHVSCGTSKGPIVLEFIKNELTKIGYERAVTLFEKGFYDQSHFFRVVPNFLVQFGISYTDDAELRKFALQTIPDDLTPSSIHKQQNTRGGATSSHPTDGGDRHWFQPGFISFAGSGQNSRTSQLFIAYAAAPSLGTQPWETPLGRVIQGMEHVKAFYSYGDMPPYGKGPVQQKIRSLGRSYITDNFPLTDHFETCHVQRLSQQSSRKWPALWSGQDIQWSDVTAWILVLVVVLFVFLIWALLRLGLWRSKKRANKTS